MPDRAVLQPNGRYAIFSSYVDHFTAYDGTRDEILSAFREEFRAEADRNAEGKLKRAEERESNNPGADFTDAIESIATVHGFDTAEQVRTQLSQPISAVDANHATEPLVSPERRRDIQAFHETLNLLCEAYGVKIKGDTDASGDILIFDLKQNLPHGYEWSAYIEPNGQLEFCDYVLEDESGATKQ